MDYCQSCKREKYHHGGDCNAKHDGKTCLLYEKDPRGERRQMEAKLKVPLHIDIPSPGDKIEVLINGVEKTIKVIKLHSVKWDKTPRGLRGVVIDFRQEYWSEENGEIPPNKPKLKLVK